MMKGEFCALSRRPTGSTLRNFQYGRVVVTKNKTPPVTSYVIRDCGWTNPDMDWGVSHFAISDLTRVPLD